MRIASFNAELDRDGPGLLLRDILKSDPQVVAVVDVVAAVNPDALALQRFDFDHELHALRAFSRLLERRGIRYPHLFALRPNSGLQTGLDLNENGRLGEAQDAQGYGEFSGHRGMAILSKYPIDRANVQDFSTLEIAKTQGLYHDSPASVLRRYEGLRLSSVGHWVLDVVFPGEKRLKFLIWHGSSPAFDGPDDRNGARGALETQFWVNYLDGKINPPLTDDPTVVVGVANIDPEDGEGWHGAIRMLLSHPRLQDGLPRSAGGSAAARTQLGVNAQQRGNPALDTADWPDEPPYPGNLRVSYILPDRALRIVESGVYWPVSGPGAELVSRASRHRLIWVDIEWNDTD